jgi:CrcB protein
MSNGTDSNGGRVDPRAARQRMLPPPGLIALVALGGAVGTTIRYVVMTLLPVGAGFPTVIAAINVSGAFLLGLLLEALLAAGPETPARRNLRLVIGTGVLGGYTTYGTFAVTEDGLIESMNAHDALLFGVPMIAAGIVAALAGAGLARLLRRSREKTPS